MQPETINVGVDRERTRRPQVQINMGDTGHQQVPTNIGPNSCSQPLFHVVKLGFVHVSGDLVRNKEN